MRERRRAVRLMDVGRETLRKFGLPDLATLAAARGWRIAWDPAYTAEDARFRAAEAPWLVRVPCRAGFIAVYGRRTLSALCNRRRTRLALLALPGVMVVQQGDVEVLVTFGVEDVDDVGAALGPRRRRRLSDQERARLIAASCPYRFARKTGVSARTASQDARSGGGEGVDSGVGGDR